MKENWLTFSDAIEQVLLHNGYYAPLSIIYKEFEKYRLKTWKTPDKTIQERVQRDKRFTKIWYWVYALTEYLHLLPQEKEVKTKKQKTERMHSRIQWMLIEIGNMEGFDTYTPDVNGIFDNKEIGKLTTLKEIPPFTYERIIKNSIKFVDVIWFNKRWFPEVLIEVENSTDFRDWFVKMNELQDFKTKFLFIAPDERRGKFDKEKAKSVFVNIAQRCELRNYEIIEKWYLNKMEAKKFDIFENWSF